MHLKHLYCAIFLMPESLNHAPELKEGAGGKESFWCKPSVMRHLGKATYLAMQNQ